MSKLEFVDIQVFGISKCREGNVKKNFFPFCDLTIFPKGTKCLQNSRNLIEGNGRS